MKKSRFSLFIIIVLIIAGCVTLAFTGVKIGGFEIKPVQSSMKLGLDIEGGVVVLYQAQSQETGAELDRLLNQTVQVMGKRVNEMGLTEPLITREGKDRIRVELPGVQNIQEAVSAIGQTAKLEFYLVTDSNPVIEGMNVDEFDSEYVLSGKEMKDAGYAYSQKEGHSVQLKMNSEGADAFANATKKASEMSTRGGQIAIVLDGKVISAPYAKSQIPGGEAIINGSFSQEQASNLGALIRGGALPVELKEIQSSQIGPTLGKNALKSALKAAQIGFALVIVFMIGYYRLPGFIASISLVLYSVLLLFTMIGFQATLTLPGVAGIVLSVGMAVDANVIIFERIKEELNNKKSLRASIDGGFKRAFRTIMDSNITTMIAAIVLFYFGEGPIRGFAVTLMIGIVISMFTALGVTKTMMRSIIGLNTFQNKKLFGAKEVA